MTRRNQHYPPELRKRAVRMVAEVTPNYDSQWAAINAVAQKLGVGTAETVRKWVLSRQRPSRVNRAVAGEVLAIDLVTTIDTQGPGGLAVEGQGRASWSLARAGDTAAGDSLKCQMAACTRLFDVIRIAVGVAPADLTGPDGRDHRATVVTNSATSSVNSSGRSNGSPCPAAGHHRELGVR
jgi:hypothetical protein